MSTQVIGVHNTSTCINNLSVAVVLQWQFLHPTVKEGGMDMQVQELWQCQHWTITPKCNPVGITKEALACARYFGTTVYTTIILF
ncbi:hypothetical protein DPMN_041510 [Dreissena polymorpha]|uniref:Uncharacterized protein n=1 Tax=Dreissena polymorpha TaxID=45954 RepID=A0A9D4CZI9_DREPO|nr:hypothetical protein DPMN_041510 [Dreissena polymorpha]